MKWLRRKRLLSQLAVVLSISLLIIMAVFTDMLLRFRNQTNQRENQYVEGVVTQLSQIVTQNYSALEKIMYLISYNRDVQRFHLTQNVIERTDNFYTIKSLLRDVSTLNPSILDIVILDQNNLRYSLGENILYPLPEMELDDSKSAISPMQKYVYYNETIPYLVLAQNIYSIDSYTQINSRIGSIYLILKPEAITGENYKDADSNAALIQLIDQEKNVLWSSNPKEGSDFSEDAPSSVENRETVQNLQIRIYRLKATWRDRLLAMGGSVPIGYLISLALLLIVWGIWVHNLIKPMHELAESVGKIGNSGLESLSVKIQTDGYQEIVMVSARINTMLEQIQNLMNTIIEKNKEIYYNQIYAKQAEISYLRSQINPHFLYNTLETMCGIAYSENQPKLAEIARALGIIFKYSIKGKDVVPLKDEIKIVKNYIFIQSIRFSEKFYTEYDIDEQCLPKLVPKMILQPLIENAVTHGIEGQEKKCRLFVTVQIQEEKLCLRITDDGSGISPEILNHLQKQLLAGKTSNTEETKHIGIANVHNRIRLLYGEPYGLRIESTQGRGTEITCLLPLQE